MWNWLSALTCLIKFYLSAYNKQRKSVNNREKGKEKAELCANVYVRRQRLAVDENNRERVAISTGRVMSNR